MSPKTPAHSAGDSAEVRAAAARVVHVVVQGRSLTAALQEVRTGGASVAQLGALAYGGCRQRPRSTRLLDRLLRRPLAARDAVIDALLCVALFELQAGETAPYAVVDASVAAARLLERPHISGLVNAVLRRFLRERAEIEAQLAGDEVARFSHPAWLIDAVRADWPAEWTRILEANDARAPLWIRVNARRTNRDDYLARLAAIGNAAHAEPRAPQALRLERPIDVSALPGFADGDVSVQDAAAQLAAPLLDARPGMRVLDACAAPGGKSAHLLETCDGLDLLALDIDPARLERAREGYVRLGLGAATREADAARTADWWDGRSYDRILLDVPCSATGVIRRHPDIKLLRRPGDIDAMAEAQCRLLDALWPLLAPGGLMLYASCSILERENAIQVQTFLDRWPEASVYAKSANLGRIQEPEWHRPGRPGLQILPGDHDMDGFYYACLRKKG